MTLEGKDERTRLRFEPVPTEAGAPHAFHVALPPELLYFEGHFVGFPVLPAVAQLSCIVVPLARREFPVLGDVVRLRRVRFRRPIGPGKAITVTLSCTELRVGFEIILDGYVASSGTVEFRPRPAGSIAR